MRGIVTIFWKESERDHLDDSFRRIRDDLDKMKGVRKMTYSCSATMTLYTTEQRMDRLVTWYHWHQHWLYGSSHPIKLPDAMPLNQASAARVPPVRNNYSAQVGNIADYQNDYGYMELFHPCAGRSDDDSNDETPEDTVSYADDGLSPTEEFSPSGSDTSSLSSDTEPFDGEV